MNNRDEWKKITCAYDDKIRRKIVGKHIYSDLLPTAGIWTPLFKVNFMFPKD